MDYFYDGQIRRFLTQFMRIFVGFKYETGDGTQKTVPVMYGDLNKQVANIIKENSENKLPSVPRIACYITGLEMDTSRLSDPSFVSKLNVRARDYTFNSAGADPTYTGEQGGNFTVERLMPTPFTLSVKADIWTSNTDQKLQLLEQMLVLFNPSLEIQGSDNYVDWTSLTTVYLESTSFSSRTIPQGAAEDIDVCSLDFTIPIYISPPTKVKKLGIVRGIIANIFTEEGDVVDLSNLIYSNQNASGYSGVTVGGAGSATAQIVSNGNYPVLLFSANNGQQYDYTLTVVDPASAIRSLGLESKEFSNGKVLSWEAIFDQMGGKPAGSLVYFKQPNNFEIRGTMAIHPTEPNILLVTLDPEGIPTNTLITSAVGGTRGTIDAIIDPFNYNPIEKFGGANNIPVGTRFLMLETIGHADNVDGADGWKGSDGSTEANGSFVLEENSIVEWDGSSWEMIKTSATLDNPTYVTNLKTGIQYVWNGTEWLKSFEGEYSPGYWRFDLDPD